MLALLTAVTIAAAQSAAPAANPPRREPVAVAPIGAPPIGMPRLPAYDPTEHVSIPMRADVHASLSPAARDAYARVSYDAAATNSVYRACAKLTPGGIASRIDARRATNDPVMGSVAVEIYAACY